MSFTKRLNQDRYAAAMAQHLDESLDALGLNKKTAETAQTAQPEPRPFARAHKPAVPQQSDILSTVRTNKDQSALFPGSPPALARWED